MNYETPNNETEKLSADERRIGEMCRTLKRVEAPKDFDFKLKARIANAKASDFEPRLVPALLRYALPALGLILIVGLLAYNGGFLSSGGNSTIAENTVAPQTVNPPQNNPISSSVPPSSNETANANTAVLPSTQDSPKSNEVAVRQPKKPETETPRRPKEDEGGGSIQPAFRDAPVLIPQFGTPRSATPNTEIDETPNPIPVREVLSQNGINADFENGRWTVKSVTPNSLGESSGVKQNDVIEEIDNQPVSGATVFNKVVNGKSVTVTRNGQRSVIKLRNKQ